jgi:hypothetical protein
MSFEKGNIINVGRILSQKTRRKMSLSHKGLNPSSWGAGFKLGNISWQTIMQQNAYFAGILDGEGSIFTTNNGVKRPGQGNYKKVCVSAVMRRDKAQPLYEAHSIWGGSLWERKPRKSMIHWALDWRMSGKIAEKFLKSVYPYLRIKKRQAQLALEYLDHQHKCMGKDMTQEVLEYRKKIEDEIRFLNH